jgi:predicted O-methyltransferase YrrM
VFKNIPPKIQTQMRRLEEIDARDRIDGTPRMKRLRQIPPETGKYLATMAATAPIGTFIEIGTSAGYSTLYLALACRKLKTKIITFELLEDKAKLARETFRLAEVEDVVELIVSDAREYLNRYTDISFYFLDAEKEHYLECYELIIKNMIDGGILIADNVISHKETLQPLIDLAEADYRVDSSVLEIGKGLLVCRKIGK